MTRGTRLPSVATPSGSRRVCALGAVLLVLLAAGAWRPPETGAAEPIKIGALTESWGPTPHMVGLRDGLRELGYVEGVDFVIGVRFTKGNTTALAPAARELVAEGADILFANSPAAIEAVRAATSRLPIVFAAGDDPVARGLVQSIARPGGNATGVLDLANQLAGKRLELFREIVPGLRRVLVAYAADNPWTETEAEAYRDAANRLGITLLEKPLHSQAEAEATFAGVDAGEIHGVLVSHSVSWNVPGFALKAGTRLKIPGMFTSSFYVERGGLASYGPDSRATGRQAARLMDKIFRGASPGTIPVESNPLIELTINMTTARRLGLEIPPLVLIRASHVYE